MRATAWRHGGRPSAEKPKGNGRPSTRMTPDAYTTTPSAKRSVPTGAASPTRSRMKRASTRLSRGTNSPPTPRHRPGRWKAAPWRTRSRSPKPYGRQSSTGTTPQTTSNMTPSTPTTGNLPWNARVSTEEMQRYTIGVSSTSPWSGHRQAPAGVLGARQGTHPRAVQPLSAALPLPAVLEVSGSGDAPQGREERQVLRPLLATDRTHLCRR